MTHKCKSKVCAQCSSRSDPEATICFCWRAPSGSVHFPWRSDFKHYWSHTTKLGGEDRKELSTLNALSFELKIAPCTSKLISSFCTFMLMAQQWVLVEAGCPQAEVMEITVASGFVPAAANGSILPWALSTEGLIFPLFFFFKNISLEWRAFLKARRTIYCPSSQKLHLNDFFFWYYFYLKY